MRTTERLKQLTNLLLDLQSQFQNELEDIAWNRECEYSEGSEEWQESEAAEEHEFLTSEIEYFAFDIDGMFVDIEDKLNELEELEVYN